MQYVDVYLDGFVQDRGISSASALEIPQSCTKPLICISIFIFNPPKVTSFVNAFLN